MLICFKDIPPFQHLSMIFFFFFLLSETPVSLTGYYHNRLNQIYLLSSLQPSGGHGRGAVSVPLLLQADYGGVIGPVDGVVVLVGPVGHLAGLLVLQVEHVGAHSPEDTQATGQDHLATLAPQVLEHAHWSGAVSGIELVRNWHSVLSSGNIGPKNKSPDWGWLWCGFGTWSGDKNDLIARVVAAGVPPEILDLPLLPKMHFYTIFRHKKAFLPPVLIFVLKKT